MTRKSPAHTATSAKAPAAKPKAPRPSVKAKVASELTADPTTKSRAKAKPTYKRTSRKPVPAPTAAATAASSAGSKQAQLIATLRSATGVPLGQMMALTGWQAHTVRAVISAVVRKKLGLKVTCEAGPEGGERLYRIVEAQA